MGWPGIDLALAALRDVERRTHPRATPGSLLGATPVEGRLPPRPRLGRRSGPCPATADPTSELAPQLEQHRRELTAYAYRMLGSAFEAEDAVQEAFVRAWRAYERFEGRAALRSWLYRIARLRHALSPGAR